MLLPNEVATGSKVLFVCCNSRCAWKESEDFAREVKRLSLEGFQLSHVTFFTHISGGSIRFIADYQDYIVRGQIFDSIKTCGNINLTPDYVARLQRGGV